MDEKRMKEVFADEAFVKSLFGKETAGEVQAALKERGLEFSEGDIMKIRERVIASANNEGELGADQLDEVAGGFVITAAAIGAAAAVVGATATTGGFVHTVTSGRW